MVWIVGIIAAIILVVIGILFLNRFYVKSTRENALVRTGAGGQKVVIDGGCFALPILHRVQKVTMRTAPVEIALSSGQSVITSDKMRVDVEMEFHVRVDPTTKGVATAAQALGMKSSRIEELKELIDGKLINAIRSVGATKTLEELHTARGQYSREIAEEVAASISNSGLLLDSVSLQRLDQTPFAGLDEQNFFNAVGMRRLSEVVAQSRKERVKIEAEADIAVRQSQLEESQSRFEIERLQRQAEIDSRQQIELMSARSEAEIARIRSETARQVSEAELQDNQKIKQAEIDRDLSLREWEMQALLKVEEVKVNNAIQLKAKRTEELGAEVTFEQARTKVIEAQENLQTQKDIVVAERVRKLAQIKSEQESELEDSRVKSQVQTLMKTAKAEADAVSVRAQAEKDKLKAEAEGRAAIIQAENSLSELQIEMQIEMHRLNKLPEIATQMMKPVEKIDSIRINHIGGFGGDGDNSGGGSSSPFNQAMQSVLGMAVQLPAMKNLGAEIGMDFDASLATRLSDSIGRSKFSSEEPSAGEKDTRQQGDQK